MRKHLYANISATPPSSIPSATPIATTASIPAVKAHEDHGIDSIHFHAGLAVVIETFN